MAKEKAISSALKKNSVAKAEAPKPTVTVYQFKITLLDFKPAIWRRIQVEDCTLDNLHEHIQTAMGWQNCHLHQFRIGPRKFADPMLMKKDMDEIGYQDSTAAMLSDIVPKDAKRFKFGYEYDFGDGWQHEVAFEGRPATENGRKYPVCLEGERACPPEDCGGPWGYADLLIAIKDKKHERHEELMEWLGEMFDAEEFDSAAATKAMKKGLPNWK